MAVDVLKLAAGALASAWVRLLLTVVHTCRVFVASPICKLVALRGKKTSPFSEDRCQPR